MDWSPKSTEPLVGPQSSPPPKTTSALSNEEVRRKIKRVDTDGSFSKTISTSIGGLWNETGTYTIMVN